MPIKYNYRKHLQQQNQNILFSEPYKRILRNKLTNINKRFLLSLGLKLLK